MASNKKARAPFLDEVLTTPLEVQLHRQAQIKAITYSNQIEGKRLDEKAVTTLIGATSTKTKDKDEKEILNYQNALSYAETLSKESKTPNIRDFCDLQKLVTAELLSCVTAITITPPSDSVKLYKALIL